MRASLASPLLLLLLFLATGIRGMGIASLSLTGWGRRGTWRDENLAEPRLSRFHVALSSLVRA